MFDRQGVCAGVRPDDDFIDSPLTKTELPSLLRLERRRVLARRRFVFESCVQHFLLIYLECARTALRLRFHPFPKSKQLLLLLLTERLRA